MLRAVKKELFGGWSKIEAIYGAALILFQLGFFVIYPESPLGFIVGLSGTICVLLVAKGKMSNYFFGLIQTGIGVYLGIKYNFIGEQWENVFYFIAQFVGIITWKNHINEETRVVKVRKYKWHQWLPTIAIIVLATIGLALHFKSQGGAAYWKDGSTLALALVATVLQVLRFREQWILWVVLNVISITQYFSVGDMSMFSFYIVMTVNTFYGYYQWSKDGAEIETISFRELFVDSIKIQLSHLMKKRKARQKTSA